MKMYKDEIITEVWRNRDAYTQARHNDLDAIVADLRKREKEHPQRVADRRKRPRSDSKTT